MLDNLEALLADLKAKAQKATPGPWEECGEDNGSNAVVTSRSNKPVKIVTALINEKQDQSFIVAANPLAILELIEAYERLEKEADWLAENLAEVSGSMFDDELEDLGLQCAHECELTGCTHECRKRNWREAAQQAISKKGREENHADR